MKKKLISIIINCHNGEKYLNKTLESILHQKYKNYEVIFVDNFSKDSSAEIFKRIQDKRFKYFKTKKKIRLYEGRNLALKKCRGEFITFLDADDWWEKDFLLSKNKFFKSSNDYGFCFSNCMHFYENKQKYKVFSSKKLPSGFILEDLLKFYFVKMGTIIIKKRLIQSLKFNSRYNIIGDYDLIIRAAKETKGMSFQNKLVNIRIHQNNFSHRNRKMFYNEFKHWIKKQNFENIYFKANKEYLLQKCEYLRIVYMLLENKKITLIFDIIKYPNFLLKLKLLVIYILPNFLISFKLKYL
tara:strand:+ start:556 stop:1449 length:894 start_codon:yes stop_codon:yes gene_type:complete